jgi:hypothetical protein
MFDVLDIGRQCALKMPYPDGLDGIPIYYHQCHKCNFIFTSFFDNFSDQNWSDYIYNDEYKRIDPDYSGKRSLQNKALVMSAIHSWWKDEDVGLDYGGGTGSLSASINSEGIKYESFDPFGEDTRIGLKEYSIISAFEVMEHLSDPLRVFDHLQKMLIRKRGLILISTQLINPAMQPGQLINSWYAAPRNGHISLYSRKAMEYFGHKFELDYKQVSRGLHIFSSGLSANEIRRKLFLVKIHSRISEFWN